MRLAPPAAAALACALAAGCVVLARRKELPPGDGAAVMVLTTRLEGPIRRIARHAYLAVREAGRPEWTIWECCSPGSHDTDDPFRPSFGDQVRLHGVWRGARAERMIPCIERETERYGSPRYWPIPGPNSNTYVETIMRRCRIHADLPATAIGKDYRGWIGLSRTSGGTGLQLETPLIGLKLGLTEGVEVHIFSLSIGVDLWPPAIIVPVGDGRIGFADR